MRAGLPWDSPRQSDARSRTRLTMTAFLVRPRLTLRVQSMTLRFGSTHSAEKPRRQASARATKVSQASSRGSSCSSSASWHLSERSRPESALLERYPTILSARFADEARDLKAVFADQIASSVRRCPGWSSQHHEQDPGSRRSYARRRRMQPLLHQLHSAQTSRAHRLPPVRTRRPATGRLAQRRAEQLRALARRRATSAIKPLVWTH